MPLLSGALALLSACANQTTNEPPAQHAQLARAVAAPDRAGPPEPLSPAAREILKARMASHSRDMAELVSSIMALDYDRIAETGDAISADVNLSRPISQDATELNAALPEKFFARQDELRAGAKTLAAAARARDPERVARDYGRLAEGCVRCHADYRPATAPAVDLGVQRHQ
jgi:cytochrome c556